MNKGYPSHNGPPPHTIHSFIFTFIWSLYDRATCIASVVETVVVDAVVIVVGSVVIVVVIGSADVVVVNVTVVVVVVVASAFKAVDSVSGSADVDCTGWAVVVLIEALDGEYTVPAD